MTTSQLERCRRRLAGPTTFATRWLQRRAAAALGRDGSADAVDALVDTLASAPSPAVAEMAAVALGRVANQDGVDRLWETWCGTLDDALADILASLARPAATPEGLRVLSLLKLGEAEQLVDGGAELVVPLLEASQVGDPAIREGARCLLLRLTDPGARNAVCREWAQYRTEFLEDVVVSGKLVADSPTDVRVLSALKTDQHGEIADTGAEVVGPLLKACEDDDAAIRERAKGLLPMLTSADARTAVCVAWARDRTELLEDAMVKGNYVADSPMDARVLSALKTDQCDKIFYMGEEVVEPLLEACRDDDPEIRERAPGVLPILTSADARTALCVAWARDRTELLEDAVVRGKFVADSPTDVRVLSALKTGQSDTVVDMGASAVGALLDACRDDDPAIQDAARLVLSGLRSPDALDELCAWAVIYGDALALEMAVSAGARPTDPQQCALFLLLTGRWDEYEKCDPDRAHLRAGYAGADPPLREKLVESSARLARVCLSPEAPAHGLPLNAATADDVEMITALLTRGHQWDTAWRIALGADPTWSARLVAMLRSAAGEQSHRDWVAGLSPEERDAWDELSSLAPDPDQPVKVRVWPSAPRDAQAGGDLARGPKARTLEPTGGVHIGCLAFSPDGHVVAAGGAGFSGPSNTAIYLWRLPIDDSEETAWSVATLRSPEDPEMCALAITPDGQLLVGAGRCIAGGASVGVWQLPEGDRVGLVHLDDFDSSPHSLVLAPDGALAITAHADGAIRLWRLPDAEPAGVLNVEPGHGSHGVHELATTPDGQLLISSCGPEVRLWRLPNGEPAGVISERGVSRLAVSPDGSLLATAPMQKGVWAEGDPEVDTTFVNVWHLPSGKLTGALRGHEDEVTALAFTPDSSTLVTGDAREVRMWRVPECRSVTSMAQSTEPEYWERVTALAVSPDGGVLASASASNYSEVRLWSLPDGDPIALLRLPEGCHDHYVRCMAFSPDGASFATADYDVRLYDMPLAGGDGPLASWSESELQGIEQAAERAGTSGGHTNALCYIAALIRQWRRVGKPELGSISITALPETP